VTAQEGLLAQRPSARARAFAAWQSVHVLTPSTTAADVLAQLGLLGIRLYIADGRLRAAGRTSLRLTEAVTASAYHDAIMRELRECPF